MLEEQRAEMASERSLVLLNGLQLLIICGGLFASMMESALRVRSGQSSLGDFVMVNSYFLQLYAPLTWMGTIYRMIQQAFVDMERMLALLDEKVDIKDAPGAEPLAADGHGRVTFEGVSLAYDDNNYVLR
jgi:ABC-type transport system involved in Fe-S cluster assembly fused permease/ATPase subunit